MKRQQPARRARPAFLDATYYGVISVSGLVGLVAYSSGASLEGALVRTVVALLACTILGCILDVILWLATSTGHAPERAVKPQAATGSQPARHRTDVVAGDDLSLEQLRAAGQALQ